MRACFVEASTEGYVGVYAPHRYFDFYLTISLLMAQNFGFMYELKVINVLIVFYVGESITGTEAYNAGLVSKLVSDELVQSEVGHSSQTNSFN